RGGRPPRPCRRSEGAARRPGERARRAVHRFRGRARRRPAARERSGRRPRRRGVARRRQEVRALLELSPRRGTRSRLSRGVRAMQRRAAPDRRASGMTRDSYGKLVLVLVTVAVIVIADQLTKRWVASTLELHASVPIFPGWLHLTYVRNTGAAFSMLAGKS